MNWILTGEMRFRTEKRLFRRPLLVVQVKIKTTPFDVDSIYAPPTIYRWVDARSEDLKPETRGYKDEL